MLRCLYGYRSDNRRLMIDIDDLEHASCRSKMLLLSNDLNPGGDGFGVEVEDLL